MATFALTSSPPLVRQEADPRLTRCKNARSRHADQEPEYEPGTNVIEELQGQERRDIEAEAKEQEVPRAKPAHRGRSNERPQDHAEQVGRRIQPGNRRIRATHLGLEREQGWP
ncbi:MAG: hypothetical protein M0002_14670 [Rhodospirillales bacterium]|nr:hypothetical protein [Rhodospirillales bacterium]